MNHWPSFKVSNVLVFSLNISKIDTIFDGMDFKSAIVHGPSLKGSKFLIINKNWRSFNSHFNNLLQFLSEINLELLIHLTDIGQFSQTLYSVKERIT